MKYFLPTIISILLFSCGNTLPKDVLPKEKMEKLLWDIAQGGEFVNGYVYYRNPSLNKAALNKEVLDKILSLHKVSRKQFDKSLAYYQQNLKQFTTILDSIAAKQNRLKSTNPQNDSLKTPLPNNIRPRLPQSAPDRVM